MLGEVFCNPSAHLLDSSITRTSGVWRVKASLSDYPLASKIFVRNLSYSTSEATLRKVFSNFGRIEEVKLIKDEETEKSKGYGFIQYSSQEAAVLAIEQMESKRMDGRIVHVELAKPMNNRFGSFPRTSGPPLEHYLGKQDS